MAEIKVYGAPWCPDCRRAKQFLGEHRIAYDWVDIDADPEAAALVRRANEGKQIIPTIVFPDGSLLVEPDNAELARKLGLQLQAGRTYYDLIVVGGGPAGLTAALYAAREGIDVLVIERSALGGQAGITERIDNYPGFDEGIAGSVLAERLVRQARRYGVELLSAVGVLDIRRMMDRYVLVATDQGGEYCAHAAIVATGSDPNTGFLVGKMELDASGFVITDQTLQTSLPGVFAAGDVRAGSTKQLAAATGEAATALLMVRGYLEAWETFPAGTGTEAPRARAASSGPSSADSV